MKKRAKAKQPRPDTFVFSLIRADLQYGFSLNHEKHASDAYSENLIARLTSECIVPAQLAGRQAFLHLMGDRDLEVTLRRVDGEPARVATLLPRKAGLDLYAMVPLDACWQLAAAVNSGSVQYLVASGSPLFRSKSEIRSMHFVQEVDLADF